MPYTRVWDEDVPVGTATPARNIDNVFREGKVDIRERFADIFGLTIGEWAADPIRVKRLITAATGFALRNDADNADNIAVTDNGDTVVRGSLAATGGLTGSAAGLTGIPAGQLIGPLPAISGAALTDLPYVRPIATGGTPTLSNQNASWTGGITIYGRDSAGRVTLVKGDGSVSFGIQFRVNFIAPYPAVPIVVFSGGARWDGDFMFALANVTVAGFSILLPIAQPFTLSDLVEIDYHVIGISP